MEQDLWALMRIRGAINEIRMYLFYNVPVQERAYLLRILKVMEEDIEIAVLGRYN